MEEECWWCHGDTNKEDPGKILACEVHMMMIRQGMMNTRVTWVGGHRIEVRV